MDERPLRMTVVECGCGWTFEGEDDDVVDAMQVHQRQIHGLEMTREDVLARSRPA
jgi:predicted small metal-binding protein